MDITGVGRSLPIGFDAVPAPNILAENREVLRAVRAVNAVGVVRRPESAALSESDPDPPYAHSPGESGGWRSGDTDPPANTSWDGRRASETEPIRILETMRMHHAHDAYLESRVLTA